MKKIIKNIIPIILVATLLFFVSNFFYKKYSLSDCQRIVIATISPGSSGSPKTGITINYEYNFANHSYQGRQLINAEEYFIHKNQRRFFAQVACKIPTISSLLLSEIVPDSIYANPVEGWENVPGK